MQGHPGGLTTSAGALTVGRGLRPVGHLVSDGRFDHWSLSSQIGHGSGLTVVTVGARAAGQKWLVFGPLYK